MRSPFIGLDLRKSFCTAFCGCWCSKPFQFPLNSSLLITFTHIQPICTHVSLPCRQRLWSPNATKPFNVSEGSYRVRENAGDHEVSNQIQTRPIIFC